MLNASAYKAMYVSAGVEGVSKGGQPERRMTVAQVRESGDEVKVMFYESPRIYRLPSDNPAYEVVLRQLRAAVTQGTAVHVRFLAPNEDVIASVRIGG